MTTGSDNPNASPGRDAERVPENDLLISRIVDGVASQADWVLLEAGAQEEPQVWKRLALAQRDQQFLSGHVGAMVARAQHVELPHEHASLALRPGRSVGILRWGGWAIAAALALAFVGPLVDRRTTPPGAMPTQVAGLGGFGSSADAFRAYVDKGQQEGSVIGEIPTHQLVQAVPLEDGRGFEVVFVRQVIERQTLPDLYRFTRDETGAATPLSMRVRVNVEHHAPSTTTPNRLPPATNRTPTRTSPGPV
jgi:hypothetical protein